MKRILLIEDAQILRELFKLLLSRESFVVTAANGQEALDALRDQTFDLVERLSSPRHDRRRCVLFAGSRPPGLRRLVRIRLRTGVPGLGPTRRHPLFDEALSTGTFDELSA